MKIIQPTDIFISFPLGFSHPKKLTFEISCENTLIKNIPQQQK